MNELSRHNRNRMFRQQYIGTDDKPSAMPSLLEHCRGANRWSSERRAEHVRAIPSRDRGRRVKEEDRRSITGKLTALRRWVLMIVLLVLGGAMNVAWGQETQNAVEDGKYYHISFWSSGNTYQNASSIANTNWYLWPSTTSVCDHDGQYYITTTNKTSWTDYTGENDAQWTGGSVDFDELYSVWQVTKVTLTGGTVVWQLYNLGTQKWLVWTAKSGNNCVHLEDSPSETNSYFDINNYNNATGHYIRPAGTDGSHDGVSLRPAGGYKDYLFGTDGSYNSTCSGPYNLMGTGSDPAWTFTEIEVKCATPVINIDPTISTVTLSTATDGATIHYTVNGSTPTADSPTYTGVFGITETTTIKAIAIKDGLEDSDVADQTLTPTVRTSGICAQEAAPVRTVQEGVPYRLRIPGHEGAQLSLERHKKSDGSVGHETYGVLRYAWNNADPEYDYYGAKNQIFYFKDAGSGYYYIKGKLYENNNYVDKYLYTNSGWKLLLDNNLQNNNNYKFTINNTYFDGGTIPGNRLVTIKGVGANWVTPGRGYYDGSGIYTDTANPNDNGKSKNDATRALSQWMIIPWNPLMDFKAFIDEVQKLHDSADVGTAANQVSQSVTDALATALSNANSTYTDLNTQYGATALTELTTNSTFTSAVCEAIRTLTTARDTYLAAVNNDYDLNQVWRLRHNSGKMLTWVNGAKPTLTDYDFNNTDQEFTLEKVDGYYYLKSAHNDQYLWIDGNIPSNGTNNEAPNGENYDKEPIATFKWIAGDKNTSDTKDQIEIVRYNNTQIGLRFAYISNTTFRDKSYLSTVNNTLIPYMEDGITNPESYWTLVPPTVVKPVITVDNNTGVVTITCPTDGATIHYTTDDTPPTAGSTTYSESNPLTITATTTVMAIAVKEGFINSEMATKQITKIATPEINLSSDGLTVEISCATEGVTFHYTTNGSTPNASSPVCEGTLRGSLKNGDEVKVIAVSATEGYINSEVGSYSVAGLKCMPPVIKQIGKRVRITCSSPEGAQIYYSLDGSDPTVLYTSEVDISDVTLSITVRAYASKDTYIKSDITEKEITSFGSGAADDPYMISDANEFAQFITDVNNNTDNKASKYFAIVNDITLSSNATITSTFTGGLMGTADDDGHFYTISGINQPLFSTLNGATIKNLVLDKVTISQTSAAATGAIANTATGTTKIYNCGIISKTGTSSVSGGANTGSLVGSIDGNTRVVNNYSYANVSGSDYVGGIVGNVIGTALNKTNFAGGDGKDHCAVVNNMFYGNLSGSSNVSPVYAGNHTSNKQNVNEYNFWLSKPEVSYSNYNDQLAIEKKTYLNRFPFYRHILNTHREIAAIYLFGSRTEANVAEIGHWYNKKNVPNETNTLPYPIIETWQTNTKRTTVDINKNLPNTTDDSAGKKLTEMGSGGMLHVNVSINGSSYSTDLPITDMDTQNYDFTWGKVVLPFANEFCERTDFSTICTGWKIKSVTKNGSTLTSFNIPTTEPYNFADRDNPQKDIYDETNNPYIFAQGGNYIVPYGVTAITIEANFANAFYLSDAYYDYGYNTSYNGQAPLTTQVPTDFHGQTVYTDLSTLLTAMGSYDDPHHQAIVLVGNFHYNQSQFNNGCFDSYQGKGLTIMSVDEDCNQEPDYGWYTYQSKNPRQIIPAMRFDFVPNIGIGMAARTTGSKPYPSIGIWHSKKWFELTETALSFMSECEINSGLFANDDDHGNNRWIVNSGFFKQIIRTYNTANCTKLSYVQIGGNAYVEQFYPGTHIKPQNGASSVALRPVVVTGGEIEECYMTGNYGTATGSNIYFWCAGGKIHKYLSAFTANPSTEGVSVTAKVDHAVIGRFFGGGTSSAARIKGDINIIMNHSKVDFYCGGPEFGDMESGKTVTTHATGSTFGEYYGAGFGGTSLSTVFIPEENAGDIFQNAINTFPLTFTTYYKYLQKNGNYGLGVGYAFDYILYSGGTGNGVARFYTKYARFSLASTGNVTNVLNDCTVTGDFYGAGCQGTVAGTVTSTLTDCTLQHNAFGGGFKASANTLDVYPNTQPTYATYTKETGVFTDFGTVNLTDEDKWHWAEGTVDTYNSESHTLYTDVDMDELGTVSGKITLNIKGSTIIGTEGNDETGNVFGGGNESPALNSTEVNIEGNTQVMGDVYGGGNAASVGGSTEVNIK